MRSAISSIRASIGVIALSVPANLVAGSGVDYLKDIKPMLKERCYACHSALKQKGGLRLDTAVAMRKGGDGGDIIAGDHPELIERIISKDSKERMPPEGEGAALNAEQVGVIRAWIAEGAPSPADEMSESDPRAHWSYQAPKSSGKTMDALIMARLGSKQLKPQPEASPEIWLRRVHLDLVGLPPSPEDIAAFLRDTSLPARERVVDRLLASPQYGERWARHFMDIWRYCDWYGLGAQLRHSQKHLWHWRDWIIESFNADKGYDHMIVEQLAADELDPNDRDNLRATGFLARSYFLFNRTTWLDDTIEHTSRALLGVTMQCVKCHDHKYDPIEQADYYKMRAVFEPMHVRLDAWPGETDFEKNGLPRVFDLHTDRATYRHVRGDEKNEDKSKAIAPGVPSVLSFAKLEPHAVPLPKTSSLPALLPFVFKDQITVAEREMDEAQRALDETRKALSRIPAEHAAKLPLQAAVEDDFKVSKPALWQIINGQWRYENGLLRQSETGAERRVLQLKATAPTDFDATLSFTIRGGQKWKSVGLVFDMDGQSNALVYMSATNSGPKLQLALTKDGKTSYPPAAAVARKILPNTRYSLNLKLRGLLLNVSIDGSHVMSYRLEGGRKAGGMAIAAFDADAEFHSFKLAELPADIPMHEAGGLAVASLSDAKSAVVTAGKKLTVAEAKAAMIRDVFAADQARQDKALARAAAAAEARYKLAQAELSLAQAAADPKAKDADKKLKAANEAAEKAKKKATAPGETYSSLHATLKAQEGPEENNNTDVQTYPESSTGRRLAFARWIADQRNPLTARVLVNHVWLRHFGAPLVADVSDFGRRTSAPLHQDVLDTLAVGFMQNGWSIKQLHRTMVLSELYARSSSNVSADPATVAADPDNSFFWRMNPRRMESQVVRDSLLSIAGKLDLTLGGPSLDAITAETSHRRSLYFTQNADVEHRFLATFDNGNVLECYRRNESVVPQQALALTNSKLSRDCADALATKLESLNDDAFIRRAFLIVVGRDCTDAERQASRQSLALLKRNLFLQALVNHNDFVTLR